MELADRRSGRFPGGFAETAVVRLPSENERFGKSYRVAVTVHTLCIRLTRILVGCTSKSAGPRLAA